MDSKGIIWLFAGVGSTVGSLIPLLWGAGFISFSSIILSAVGAIVGIIVGFKLTH